MSAIKKCESCGKYSARTLDACRYCGENFALAQPHTNQASGQPHEMSLQEAKFFLNFAAQEAQRAYMHSSVWGRLYFVLDSALGLVLMPLLILQYFSTFILGIVVQLSFGLALLPMSLPWIPMMLLLRGGSRVWMSVPVLRPILLLPLLALAHIAGQYVAFMPSMGEWDSRMAKLAICYGCPASHVAMSAWSLAIKYDDKVTNLVDLPRNP